MARTKIGLSLLNTNIVHASGATNTAISAGTFTATTVTATITPSSASSRIMIMVFFVQNNSTTTANAGRSTIYRNNTTNLMDASGGGQTGVVSAAASNYQTINMVWVDSPATTSATTYTVYGLSDGTSGNINFGNGRTWSMILQEIA